MSPEGRTSGVSMLEAFKRDAELSISGRLVYPNLESVALEASQKEYALLREFWQAEPGSVHEEDRARDAALGYLILTGLQLQNTNPKYQRSVSDRLTEASIELYGQPEFYEYQKIVNAKIAEFRAYRKNPEVDQTRNQQILEVLRAHQISDTNEVIADSSDGNKDRQAAAKLLVETLEIRFADVLEAFEKQSATDSVSTDEVVTIYQAALNVLKSNDSAWEGWSIKPEANQKTFASDAKKKEIIIGMKHDPLTVNKARQLFYHELFAHSLRSVNGSKTSEPMMQYGMPGFLGAEEGLGVFLEYGLSGEVDNIRTDRYLDFGFALSTSGKTALNRSQIQQLYVNREIVRKQARQEVINEEEIQQSGWRYVNRIFRGALDNDVIAVNTKDLAYYRGFVKIGDYITKSLHDGMSEADLLDYILSGKFDPTNKRHTALVATLI